MTDTYNQIELLKFAVQNGILDMSYMQAQIEMKKKEDLLKKHPYAIWQGADGNWYTYFPDNTKKNNRRKAKRSSKESITTLIIEYWKEEVENPTVRNIYNEWIAYKLEMKDIGKPTRDRYNRQFNQSCSEFGERRIKRVTALELEEFCRTAIVKNELTQKGFNNLKTILRGIFKRAKKKGLVSFSVEEVIKDMEISRNCFRRVINELDRTVFSDIELVMVYEVLLANQDLINLGLLLMFKTGMRPGELCSLKPQNIGKNWVHINATEINYYGDDGKIVYEVKDFPKSDAGIRDIIVRDADCWILQKLLDMNPNGKYLFEKNGERLKELYFANRLEQICHKVRITEKSPNKARKTYASVLIDNRVEDSVVISQLGHTNISTSLRYYYKNRKSAEQVEVSMNKIADL